MYQEKQSKYLCKLPPPSKEKLYEVEVYEIGMVPTSQVCSQNIQRLHL